MGGAMNGGAMKFSCEKQREREREREREKKRDKEKERQRERGRGGVPACCDPLHKM